MSNKDNNENLQIGSVYKISLTSGAIMMGVLFYKGEILIDNNVVNQYGISFDKESYIYLHDTQIATMEEVKPIDTEDYFRKFQKMYGIKCFDKKGELLSASKILENLIFSNTWSKLSKRTRRELIQEMHFNDGDIWDMIEAFLEQKRNNDKLQYDRLNELEAELKEVMDQIC